MHFHNVNQSLNNFVPSKNSNTRQQSTDDDNLYILFNDNNGIVEKTDFEYSSPEAKKLAQPYLKGLNPFCDGKHRWTQALLDFVQNLINMFNIVNNYNYGIANDEPVKNASYDIKYGKDGRVLSTTLKTADNEYSVVYKYYKNGEIDSASYKDDYTYEYRTNGTRFSATSEDLNGNKEMIRYNQNGKKSFYKNESVNNLKEITYDDNENVIKEFYKNRSMGIQKIYFNGTAALVTVYNSVGKVTKYLDDYFQKKSENNLNHRYLGTKVHKDISYNTLYNQSPIDGKITEKIKQGTSGTCYAAGIINSLVLTPAGRRLLDNALPNDTDNSKCIVKFKGLDETYTLQAEEISHNMSRLGRKDGDYSGMILAFEKFRESGKLFDGTKNLPKCFYEDHRDENDRRVDSGNPAEFFYALTGKEMTESGAKITDKDIEHAKQCLASRRGVVNAGTIIEENKYNEIPAKDRANGIFPKHNLSVVKISSNYITIYDSVTERETNLSIDKFKKYFSKLYWATVD